LLHQIDLGSAKLFAKGYPLRGDAAIVVVRWKKRGMAASNAARCAGLDEGDGRWSRVDSGAAGERHRNLDQRDSGETPIRASSADAREDLLSRVLTGPVSLLTKALAS
jgi:hypothetical protein